MNEPRSTVTIERVDMGTGWACFQAAENQPLPEHLSRWLNRNFSEWLDRHPEFRVRATLPIVDDGQTVAIHVWYD